MRRLLVFVTSFVLAFVFVFVFVFESSLRPQNEQTPLSEYTSGSGRCRNRELESFSNDISITVTTIQSQLYPSHNYTVTVLSQSQFYAFTLHLFSHCSSVRMDWVILLMTGAAPRLRVLYLSNAITIDTGRNRQTRTHRQKYCQMIEEILEDN